MSNDDIVYGSERAIFGAFLISSFMFSSNGLLFQSMGVSEVPRSYAGLQDEAMKPHPDSNFHLHMTNKVLQGIRKAKLEAYDDAAGAAVICECI